MITKVTSEEFADLVNPYTGKPMEVMMNVTSSGALFFSPDTYSTAVRVGTPEECYRGWNRVNGIEGGRTDRPIVCAYTGKPLSVVHTDLGCYYAGGFDPRMFHTREDFLYYATMRGGVPKRPKPAVTGRVKAEPRNPEVTDRAKAHAEAETPSLDEEKIHMVEKSMERFGDVLPDSPTVSMSVTSKGTKRRHGR